MCIFVILCVEKTLFYMREYSDAIKLPKSFRAVGFMYKIYKKRCTRLATASDKVYQWLAAVVSGSLASSSTKSGRHDIAEILLKVALIT
jgi:hypothetical protein